MIFESIDQGITKPAENSMVGAQLGGIAQRRLRSTAAAEFDGAGDVEIQSLHANSNVQKAWRVERSTAISASSRRINGVSNTGP